MSIRSSTTAVRPPERVRPRAAPALLVAWALTLGACATTVEDPAARTAGDTAPTSTTRPIPSAEHPLRVALAGDSVMAGLVPPLLAAFAERGAAEGRFVLTPSILRDPAVRFTWKRQVEDFAPEVVVVLMGTWEAMIIEGEDLPGAEEPGSLAWVARYRTDVLEPWVDLLTEHGARVVWVGMPPIAEGVPADRIAELNATVERLADDRDDLTYVAPDVLTGPGGEPVEVLEIDGEPARIRQIDGLHLCPAGAALLATDVLEVLADIADLPLSDGWRDADWPDHEMSPGTRTYAVESCPPLPEG